MGWGAALDGVAASSAWLVFETRVEAPLGVRGSGRLAASQHCGASTCAVLVCAELLLCASPNPAVEALDMFLSIVGAEAGHMALRSLATGGVYVCGGIPPRVSLGGLAAGEESVGWVACKSQ